MIYSFCLFSGSCFNYHHNDTVVRCERSQGERQPYDDVNYQAASLCEGLDVKVSPISSEQILNEELVLIAALGISRKMRNSSHRTLINRILL